MRRHPAGHKALWRVMPWLLTAFLSSALAYANPVESERLAVLVLSAPGTNAALGDNLTDVAIARVADLRRGELAGTDEFRRRLGLGDDRKAFACLSDTACLGRAGVALGVRKAVTGAVSAEQGRYMLDLSLTNIETGRVDARFFRLVSGDLVALIAAVREGIGELFQPREEPGRLRVEFSGGRARVSVDDIYIGTTPVLSNPLLPGPYDVRVEQERRFPWKARVELKPAAILQIKVSDEMMPARRTWPTLAAFGGFVTAGAVGLAGGTFAALSQLEPASGSRADLQADLDRRQQFASTANVLFVTGAILTASAAVVLWAYWRDIVGD